MKLIPTVGVAIAIAAAYGLALAETSQAPADARRSEGGNARAAERAQARACRSRRHQQSPRQDPSRIDEDAGRAQRRGRRSARERRTPARRRRSRRQGRSRRPGRRRRRRCAPSAGPRLARPRWRGGSRVRAKPATRQGTSSSGRRGGEVLCRPRGHPTLPPLRPIGLRRHDSKAPCGASRSQSCRRPPTRSRWHRDALPRVCNEPPEASNIQCFRDGRPRAWLGRRRARDIGYENPEGTAFMQVCG